MRLSLSLGLCVSLSLGLGEPLQFPPMKLVSLFVIRASALLAVSPTWQLRTAGCLQLLSRPSETCWLKGGKHRLLHGRRRAHWLVQIMSEGSTGEPHHGVCHRCSASFPDLGCSDRIPDLGCSDRIPDLGCSDRIPELGCSDRVPDWSCSDRDPDWSCSDRVPDLCCSYGLPDLSCSHHIPDLNCSFRIPNLCVSILFLARTTHTILCVWWLLGPFIRNGTVSRVFMLRI